MFGRSAVSLQSSCSANLFSQEKVESTSWLKSSRSLELHPKSRSKPWIQITKNTDSHKSGLFHGKRCLDIERRERQSTSFLSCCSTIQSKDQHLSEVCWTHTLMSCEIQTLVFLTDNPCLNYSTSRWKNTSWSHKQSKTWFRHGTTGRKEERKSE